MSIPARYSGLCTYCGHAPHPDACPASIRTTTRPDQQRPRTARKDLA